MQALVDYEGDSEEDEEKEEQDAAVDHKKEADEEVESPNKRAKLT